MEAPEVPKRVPTGGFHAEAGVGSDLNQKVGRWHRDGRRCGHGQITGSAGKGTRVVADCDRVAPRIRRVNARNDQLVAGHAAELATVGQVDTVELPLVAGSSRSADPKTRRR